MRIKSAEFVTSVANENFYKSDFSEVSFVGRSNCGKSSLINALTGRKLAKTSNTPGRTRLINYFLVTCKNEEEQDKKFLLVDLPGYGYAEAPKHEQKKWGELLEEYLKKGEKIKCVYILLDIRREPSEKDMQMVKFLYFYNIPFVFVATKADKISRPQQSGRVTAIINALGITKAEIMLTSSQTGQGLEQLWDDIAKRI